MVVLTGFVMCGCVYVGVRMCGCFGNVQCAMCNVQCVLVFTVFFCSLQYDPSLNSALSAVHLNL